MGGNTSDQSVVHQQLRLTRPKVSKPTPRDQKPLTATPGRHPG
jgi:hypothetical protein